MNKLLILLSILFFFNTPQGTCQKKIDQAFVFPSNGGYRNYSIYEPSGLVDTVPIKMMVGFHPFELGTWNAKSYRDTLIALAESKNLLIVCPDGGQDGRIDEDFDYKFTKALIDSMIVWYNVDVLQVYAIGFGEGGKAVYEYGLNHKKTFKGFIPIGASITGTTFVDDVIHKANCKNYYIIHGSSDQPNTRYYPIRDELILNNARVNSILMASIGHTYNFPNREAIMRSAFTYVDTATCDFTGIDQNQPNGEVIAFPTIISQGQSFEINILNGDKFERLKLFAISMDGRVHALEWDQSPKGMIVNSTSLDKGIFVVLVLGDHSKMMTKIIIH